MKSFPENSEVFIGNGKFQVDVKNVDLNEFFANVQKWGNECSKGLVCGIYGCAEDPDSPCPICKCRYCSTHIKVHFHVENSTGILLRDVKEV